MRGYGDIWSVQSRSPQTAPQRHPASSGPAQPPQMVHSEAEGIHKVVGGRGATVDVDVVRVELVQATRRALA